MHTIESTKVLSDLQLGQFVVLRDTNINRYRVKTFLKFLGKELYKARKSDSEHFKVARVA